MIDASSENGKKLRTSRCRCWYVISRAVVLPHVTHLRWMLHRGTTLNRFKTFKTQHTHAAYRKIFRSEPPYDPTPSDISLDMSGSHTLETLRFDNSALRELPLDPQLKNFTRSVPNSSFSLVDPEPVEKPKSVVSHLHLVPYIL